jgi:hypothetical protein
MGCFLQCHLHGDCWSLDRDEDSHFIKPWDILCSYMQEISRLKEFAQLGWSLCILIVNVMSRMAQISVMGGRMITRISVMLDLTPIRNRGWWESIDERITPWFTLDGFCSPETERDMAVILKKRMLRILPFNSSMSQGAVDLLGNGDVSSCLAGSFAQENYKWTDFARTRMYGVRLCDRRTVRGSGIGGMRCFRQFSVIQPFSSRRTKSWRILVRSHSPSGNCSRKWE